MRFRCRYIRPNRAALARPLHQLPRIGGPCMKRFTMLAVVALALSAPASDAQIMWVIENSTDQLCTINVNTLTTSVVGPLGLNWTFGGLAFDSAGTLYGTNTLTESLYRINTSTGAATLIGTPSQTGLE